MKAEEWLQALLSPYVAKLGVAWEIKYQLQGGFIAIAPDIEEPFHTIYYHEHIWSDLSRYLPSFLHELAHAHLVEKIDRSFAIAIPSVAYRNSREWNETNLAENLQVRNDTWRFIDIWVNDVAHAHWPKIFEKHYRDTIERLEVAAEEEKWDFLASMIPFSVSQVMADGRRHSLPHPTLKFSRVLSRTSPKVRRQMIAYVNFMASLPRLSYDRDKDLSLLEKSSQEIARIWDYPVKPEFSEENGRIVWDFNP